MPTAKTECTELSVGFGLLGIVPEGLTAQQVENCFSGSLSQAKYIAYVAEFDRDPALYQQFVGIGNRLRTIYPLFANLSQVTWSGPQQQAATTSASKDLFAGNVPISVKNESNVVLNPSPHNLFMTIPSGSMPASQAENWYETMDPQGIQALYGFAQEQCALGLPGSFREFDHIASGQDRDALQACIQGLGRTAKAEFTRLYKQMCRNVAAASSARFNENYQAALASNIRSSMQENIVKQFFRINAVPYLLVGLDRHRPFALQIPDLTAWKRDWRIHNLVATPDLTRGQSVVNICMTLEGKTSKASQHMDFHVEIRWSHGKFCGNPEAKLYKEFPWSSVPFFGKII